MYSTGRYFYPLYLFFYNAFLLYCKCIRDVLYPNPRSLKKTIFCFHSQALFSNCATLGIYSKTAFGLPSQHSIIKNSFSPLIYVRISFFSDLYANHCLSLTKLIIIYIILILKNLLIMANFKTELISWKEMEVEKSPSSLFNTEKHRFDRCLNPLVFSRTLKCVFFSNIDLH